MSEQVQPFEATQGMIEVDVGSGTSSTFEFLIAQIRERGGIEADSIFELAHSNLVQVDIGVETEKPFRVSLHKLTTGQGDVKSFDIWNIDTDGSPVSDTVSLMTYTKKDGSHKTVIRGSSRGSIDGDDMEITPVQLASFVNNVLHTINRLNWRLVVGRENIPGGEV